MDAEIDRRLDKHFRDKLDLLKGFKGIGKSTQAVLMSMLPELSHADRRGIGKPGKVLCIAKALAASERAPETDLADEEESLTCCYAGGYFELTRRGVFFHTEKSDKGGKPKAPLWICSSLRIEAKIRDEWGRLLVWQDDRGVTHRWAMPMALLQGDGLEVRKEPAGQGLNIAPSATAQPVNRVFAGVSGKRDDALRRFIRLAGRSLYQIMNGILIPIHGRGNLMSGVRFDLNYITSLPLAAVMGMN